MEQIFLFVISFVANAFSAFAINSITPPHFTHKIASVALGVGATIRYLRESKLERRFALYVLITGVPGVIIGANIN